MHEIIREFEHNEKNVKMITELQNEIRALVISTKTPVMKLKKMFKIFTEASTGKLGQTDFLQIFSKKSQEIIEQINKNAPFLIHPDPVVMYSSGLQIIVLICSDIDLSDLLVKIVRPVPSMITSDIKHDFMHELFTTAPNEDNECFVSKLNYCLYDSFNKIQEGAKVKNNRIEYRFNDTKA